MNTNSLKRIAEIARQRSNNALGGATTFYGDDPRLRKAAICDEIASIIEQYLKELS